MFGIENGWSYTVDDPSVRYVSITDGRCTKECEHAVLYILFAFAAVGPTRARRLSDHKTPSDDCASVPRVTCRQRSVHSHDQGWFGRCELRQWLAGYFSKQSVL